VKQLKVFLSKR